MPTPSWLAQSDLPQNSAGLRYLGPDQVDQVLDQFKNWRGNVNGGGHNLSNVGVLGVASLSATSLSATTFIIDSLAGTNRTLKFKTSGVDRWTIYANSSGEGGANAGSDFILLAHDDAGVALSTPIQIVRNSGNVGVGGAPAARLGVKQSANNYAGGIGLTASADANTWFAYLAADYSYRLNLNGDDKLSLDTGGNLAIDGTLTLGPQTPGGAEGGELHILDGTGSAYWIIDNLTQNLRFFRNGTGALIEVTAVGELLLNAGHIAQAAWVHISSFDNGWGNFGGGWSWLRFRRDKQYRVWVTGTITGGPAGVSRVCYVPAGMAPPVTTSALVNWSNVGPVEMSATSDGQLLINAPSVLSYVHINGSYPID